MKSNVFVRWVLEVETSLLGCNSNYRNLLTNFQAGLVVGLEQNIRELVSSDLSRITRRFSFYTPALGLLYFALIAVELPKQVSRGVEILLVCSFAAHAISFFLLSAVVGLLIPPGSNQKDYRPIASKVWDYADVFLGTSILGLLVFILTGG